MWSTTTLLLGVQVVPKKRRQLGNVQATGYALSPKMEQLQLASRAGSQVFFVNTLGAFWENLIQGTGGQVDQVWKIASKSSAEDDDRGAQEKQQSCADAEGDGQRLPQEPPAQVCIQ